MAPARCLAQKKPRSTDEKTEQRSYQLFGWDRTQAWDRAPVAAWWSPQGLHDPAHPVYSVHNPMPCKQPDHQEKATTRLTQNVPTRGPFRLCSGCPGPLVGRCVTCSPRGQLEQRLGPENPGAQRQWSWKGQAHSHAGRRPLGCLPIPSPKDRQDGRSHSFPVKTWSPLGYPGLPVNTDPAGRAASNSLVPGMQEATCNAAAEGQGWGQGLGT